MGRIAPAWITEHDVYAFAQQAFHDDFRTLELHHRLPLQPLASDLISLRTIHVRQPTVLVGRLTGGDGEEFALYRLSDWSASATADRDAINRLYGRDLGSRAGKEYLVRHVEHFTRHRLEAHFHLKSAKIVKALSRVMPIRIDDQAPGV